MPRKVGGLIAIVEGWEIGFVALANECGKLAKWKEEEVQHMSLIRIQEQISRLEFQFLLITVLSANLLNLFSAQSLFRDGELM